jgi:endonuclease/exonuclease/phosphatase family metal-dependent hydrolase
MSIRTPPSRIAPQLLQTPSKITPPPARQSDSQAQLASMLAKMAQLVDSFAQAAAPKAAASQALSGVTNRAPGLDQAPQPEPFDVPFPAPQPETSAARQGFSSPVSAGELPDAGNGTGVLTLNLANGQDQGNDYREATNRQDAAALIDKAGASILAFQEADVGVNRSGDVNTALDVISRVPGNESFGRAFTPAGELRPDAPAGASKRALTDGTTFYQTDQGTLLTGTSFTADQHAIEGDNNPNASYGNALYVGKPDQVVDAYTVVLPNEPDKAGPPVDLTPQGDGTLTDAQRAALTQRNDQLRASDASEPRTALVARVIGEDGRPKTIINTHLATESHKELRETQLQFLADLARAESQATPPRELVVLGDFNSSRADVKSFFDDAGLHQVVGGPAATGANYDQIWTSKSLPTDDSAQVPTEGTSDHEYAGYTVLR